MTVTQPKFSRQLVALWLFPVCACVCLLPMVSSASALLLGTSLSLLFGNPYQAKTRKFTPLLLQCAVVGLGAGMNLMKVAEVGLHGLGHTVVGISLTLLLGTVLARLLKTEGDTGILVTVGTAICGGSAIAAVAPAIRAKNHEVTVALATVFLLNAVALFSFPWIGHRLDLSETQFGLWAALAIHDTSSVVGASLQYGPLALQIGTTVKLARALWIVPVAFVIGHIYSKRSTPTGGDTAPAKRPWFILGFVLVAALVTFVPELQPVGKVVEQVAKRLMVLTLFLIGSGLTRATLRSAGPRPLILGVLLWLLVASASLGAILLGWMD